MFMEVAITAIGIAVVLMVGFIVVSQVRSALPTSTATIQTANECLGQVGATGTGTCVNASGVYTFPNCGTTNVAGSNTSALVACPNVGYTSGTAGVQVTVFAGFGLIAVGIIVLAAFGLISVFRQ